MSSRPRWLRFVRCGLLLTAVIALGGCGGESDEDQVRTVVRAWFSGYGEGDTASACGALSETAKDAYTGGEVSCEEQVQTEHEALGDQAELARNAEFDVSVNGEQATANYQFDANLGQRTIVLEKSDSGWFITQLP